MTLETQVNAIESANMNLETMQAMRRGADALKQIHGSLCVSLIAYNKSCECMLIITSTLATSTKSIRPWTPFESRWISRTRSRMPSRIPSEWATILTRCVRVQRFRWHSLTLCPFIQDELKNELEELEQEELNDRLVGADSVPVHTPQAIHSTPTSVAAAPSRKQAVEDDDDAELRALQAELAM